MKRDLVACGLVLVVVALALVEWWGTIMRLTRSRS